MFGRLFDGIACTLLLALFFQIFGNGFFKPNISSMVGQLYPKQQKNKLDSAFTMRRMAMQGCRHISKSL